MLYPPQPPNASQPYSSSPAGRAADAAGTPPGRHRTFAPGNLLGGGPCRGDEPCPVWSRPMLPGASTGSGVWPARRPLGRRRRGVPAKTSPRSACACQAAGGGFVFSRETSRRRSRRLKSRWRGGNLARIRESWEGDMPIRSTGQPDSEFGSTSGPGERRGPGRRGRPAAGAFLPPDAEGVGARVRSW